jgi:hypothetical protein
MRRCCARATAGKANAEPPIRPMNSRRFTDFSSAALPWRTNTMFASVLITKQEVTGAGSVSQFHLPMAQQCSYAQLEHSLRPSTPLSD